MKKRLSVVGRPQSSTIVGLVLSISLLHCVAAGAQEQRVALVIGNGRYQHNATLVNPPNDAADMAAALKKDGFTVTLLTDASRKAMEQAVRAFGNSLKNPESVGMFYYSGHGAQADGENFLIPVDADIQAADELAYNAVDAESILAKMRSAGNKINIVVMDACRDNPFPGASRSTEKGLAVVKAKVPESVIVFATDPGSTASDGTGRNSPFTKAFLDNMDAPGQDITELMKRVTSRVRTDTDGKQTPWVSTNLTKDFSFRSTSRPTVIAPVQPPVTPTISVTRLYGSLLVTTATDGTLYLDGKAMADVPAGAQAKLDSVEIGERSLELRYADGQVERHTATVEAESGARVSFTYRVAPPAAVTLEGQTAPSAQTPAEVVPKDALQNGDSLPKASIKINGQWDDWNGILPAFTSGRGSPEKENLAIDKVYLAVDQKNLYMRIDIKDVTPSSFFHPHNFMTDQRSSYGLDLENGKNHVIVQVIYSIGAKQNEWLVITNRWLTDHSADISKTTYYAMKGPRVEAAFPLKAIKENLGITSGSYKVTARTGYCDAQLNWVEGVGDRTESKQLTF